MLGIESSISAGVRAGAEKYFEGCLPVEVIAMRGKDALAYGPMRPVGLIDSRTGWHAFAVVQMRQDNLAKTLYNLVGFQTNLKYSEQERVFRLIPGLKQAEFARFGQMHRNTFIFSPGLIQPTLQYNYRQNLFFSGQITGVEGYVGNIATGYLAGLNAANLIRGKPMVVIPQTTMIGALVYYITHAAARDFQPMKANFGIIPELAVELKGKRERAAAYAARSHSTLQQYIDEQSELINIGSCA
jgi:methylenetetrahydrofolate--tRNA-(uracil-5-)-methyltransferase